MKKLTTLVLALALAASLAVPAFAANTTTLTTTVPAATYTLNIPADQEIPFGAMETNIGSVSVTDSAGFAEGKNQKVTLTYGDFTCEDTSTKIPFRIRFIDKTYTASDHYMLDVASGEALTFKGQASGKTEQYMQFESGAAYVANQMLILISSTDWGKALAGNYSATITFTAEVVSG